MRNLMALVFLIGCSTSDEPQPDAAPADATADCTSGLPSCFSLGCAVGALPLDCPRPDDPSAPCYCAAPTNPGWCQR